MRAWMCANVLVWVSVCVCLCLCVHVCLLTLVCVHRACECWSESMCGKHPQPSQNGVRSVGDSSCVGTEDMNNMKGYVDDKLRYEKEEGYTTPGQRLKTTTARSAKLRTPSRHLVKCTIIYQLQCQAPKESRRKQENVPEEANICANDGHLPSNELQPLKLYFLKER